MSKLDIIIVSRSQFEKMAKESAGICTNCGLESVCTSFYAKDWWCLFCRTQGVCGLGQLVNKGRLFVRENGADGLPVINRVTPEDIDKYVAFTYRIKDNCNGEVRPSSEKEERTPKQDSPEKKKPTDKFDGELGKDAPESEQVFYCDSSRSFDPLSRDWSGELFKDTPWSNDDPVVPAEEDEKERIVESIEDELARAFTVVMLKTLWDLIASLANFSKASEDNLVNQTINLCVSEVGSQYLETCEDDDEFVKTEMKKLLATAATNAARRFRNAFSEKLVSDEVLNVFPTAVAEVIKNAL